MIDHESLTGKNAYWLDRDSRKSGPEYLLARDFLRQAAEWNLIREQVRDAINLCRMVYAAKENRLLISVNEADDVFNFCI